MFNLKLQKVGQYLLKKKLPNFKKINLITIQNRTKTKNILGVYFSYLDKYICFLTAILKNC